MLVGAPGPGLPRRTIRFVLFNAEEQGLVGRGAYARNQAALGTPIVAVFQMDMIGFDVIPDRTFELHAGFTPPPRSRPSRSTSPRPSPSSVPRYRPSCRPRRSTPPTANSIWPRAAATTTASIGGIRRLPGIRGPFRRAGERRTPAEPNPNYHRPTDTAYAADIARLVTAAAWVAATR